MDTDREWEIMLLEIEAENKDLIANFYLERMRPRDQELLFQTQEQNGIQDSQRQISPDNRPV